MTTGSRIIILFPLEIHSGLPGNCNFAREVYFLYVVIYTHAAEEVLITNGFQTHEFIYIMLLAALQNSDQRNYSIQT